VYRQGGDVVTGEQDVTIDAIREHHGTASIARQQDGTAIVVVPQDRSYRVLLDGDAVDLDAKRLIPRSEIREHGC
jgi:hypothetical protein